MMIPVQEFFVQTKENRKFNVYIEKHADSIFKWNLYCWDTKLSFSGGYPSKTAYNNSANAYKEMLNFIINYLNQRNDNDSIEFIDNPCNCELIDFTIQNALVSEANQSFPVKVNGKC